MKTLTELPQIRCDWCGEIQPLSAGDYHADKFICRYCHKPNEVVVRLDSRKLKLPPQEEGYGE